MDQGLFHGFLTLVAMLGFVGIAAWAWSGKRRADFERAARMPLDDDGPDAGDGR